MKKLYNLITLLLLPLLALKIIASFLRLGTTLLSVV